MRARLSLLLSVLNQPTSFQVFPPHLSTFGLPEVLARHPGSLALTLNGAHAPHPGAERQQSLSLCTSSALIPGVCSKEVHLNNWGFCIQKPAFSYSNSKVTFIHSFNQYLSSLWVSDHVILLTLIKRRCTTFNKILGKNVITLTLTNPFTNKQSSIIGTDT